jgi:hypothetical protein
MTDERFSAFRRYGFSKEIVPEFISDNWIKQCDPAMLPEFVRDYERIRDYAFSGKTPVGDKLYLATAGSPCSGKSTELGFEITEGSDPRYKNAVFSDPDRGVMEYMFTYRSLLSAETKAKLGLEEAAKAAYDTTRPASNVIANYLLNEAFNASCNIIHGTTLTAPIVGDTLKKYGEAGYERRLLLCYAPDRVRLAAGEKRIKQEGQYQVDPKDFIEKGKLFPQRHVAYFENADHLVLLWKNDVEKRATRAAEYKNGQCFILDQPAFDAYVEKYELDRRNLARENTFIHTWKDAEEKYFARFENPKEVTLKDAQRYIVKPQEGLKR